MSEYEKKYEKKTNAIDITKNLEKSLENLSAEKSPRVAQATNSFSTTTTTYFRQGLKISE